MCCQLFLPLKTAFVLSNDNEPFLVIQAMDSTRKNNQHGFLQINSNQLSVPINWQNNTSNNLSHVNKLGHPIEFHGFLYQGIVKKKKKKKKHWSLAGLKFGEIKPQMTNNTCHIAPCHCSFTKNNIKMEKPCVTKSGHPYC